MTAYPDVIAILQAAARSEHDITQETFDRWARWCSANDETPFPAAEDAILRYLHDNDHWSWSYRRTVVHALNRYHRDHGQAPNQGLRTARYLRAVERVRGRSALPKSSAISATHLPILVEAMTEPTAPMSAWVRSGRALVSVAVLLGLPLWGEPNPGGVSATCAHVGVTEDGLAITVGEPVVDISRDRNPDLADFILAATGEAGDPKLIGTPPGTLRFMEQHAIRAGITGDLRDADTWRALDPDFLLWVLLTFDTQVHRAARNRAVLLVGTELGRRFQDLREVTNGDVRTVDDGLQITFPRSKTDRAGRGETRTIHHVTTDPHAPLQPCHPVCAACALEDLLGANAAEGYGTRDPILASRYGGRVRPLTRQRMNQVLRDASRSLSEDAHFSTRGMRAGLVTSMVENGATIQEIQAVTGHRSASEALRYNRRRETGGPLLGLTWDD